MHKAPIHVGGPDKSNQASFSGIRERLLKGGSAQGFSQVVHIVIRLAEVPLLLTFWGTQLYGEWLMVSAIPSYLYICDGGFAMAACREMTIRGGAGDNKSVQSVFQSTWLLLIAISISTFLLTLALVNSTSLGSLLGFTVINHSEVEWVLLLLIVHLLICFQGELLNGGFWVTGSYPRGMCFIAATQLIEFIGFAAIVMMGGKPVLAASGYLLGRLVGTGLMWFGQRRVNPWLRYGIKHASFSAIKRLTTPALSSLAFPLGNALNIQGMRLVVGLSLGPAAVAVFVPMRTLSRMIMQPGVIVNRLIEPELAFAYGAKDNSLLQHIFTKSCQLALWGCAGVCLLVGIGAHWIFPVWTGGMVSIHWPSYLVLLGVVLINSIWYTALMVPYSSNRHGRIAPYYALVYGVSAVGLGYIWAARFGLGGAALALLLVEAALAMVVIRAASHMANVPVLHWLRFILRPPLDLAGKAGSGLFRRTLTSKE